MTPVVLITLVLGICSSIFASITAPLILARRTERMHQEDMARTEQLHREDLFADYQRQDKVAKAAAETARAAAAEAREVAAQAAEAARLLQAAQAETIARTDEVARLTAEQADSTNGKLDVIHELVNSAFSAALASQLDALVTSLAMMREVIDLKRSAGHEPTEEAVIALQATEAKIAELRATLADRLQQAEEIAALAATAVAATETAAKAAQAKAVPHER
jgi:hypothetical protein